MRWGGCYQSLAAPRVEGPVLPRELKEEDGTKMSPQSGLFLSALSAVVILLISAADVNAVFALNYGSEKAKEFWESQGRMDAE
ncbi:hypothetical protein MRX96_039126 [Rhipicephalus microplus]